MTCGGSRAIPGAGLKRARHVAVARIRKREMMTGKLAGKVALVTAAAQGIGRATAALFAREGGKVWATDVNAAQLAELDGAAGVTTRRPDVRASAARAALVAAHGAVAGRSKCAGN